MSENTNYKFGENNAAVYNGKPKISPLKKFGFINSTCVFFTLFMIANIVNSVAVELNIDKQTNSLIAEKSKVNEEHEKLKKQIKFYKSNEGIEKIARDSLGLIKNNEVPVRYIDKK
jgi:cell division protein FtsB